MEPAEIQVCDRIERGMKKHEKDLQYSPAGDPDVRG